MFRCSKLVCVQMQQVRVCSDAGGYVVHGCVGVQVCVSACVDGWVGGWVGAWVRACVRGHVGG